MNPILWALIGAGAVWLVGFLVACFVERDTPRVLLGVLGAVLVAPVTATAHLFQRASLIGAVSLDATALQRFAGMKQKGGGRALVLFYSPRLGVIFVRGLRDNEPVPPIRVRSADEREAV